MTDETPAIRGPGNEKSVQSAYIPGVCNINSQEVAKRRQAGYIGTVLFIVLLVLAVVMDVSLWIRIILFAPAFLATIGFLQAHRKFCVAYGADGMQNADPQSKHIHLVDDPAARQKDKKRAWQLNLQAGGIAAILTVAALFVPRL